jgi:hypothetical protein
LAVASKEDERAVLKMCMTVVAGFPKGPIDDHESPDFLVTTGGRTVGIEMQEFIHGATSTGAAERHGESVRAAVMNRAQREFEVRHGSTHLYVYAHWSRARALDRHEVRVASKKVAALVEKLVPPLPEVGEAMSGRNAAHSELEEADLAGWLTHLKVLRYRPATYGLWASPEWGYASQNVEDLETQICAKTPKVPTYRESCAEIWLVLYSGFLPSGGFEIDVLRGRRVSSPFDHVVFFDVVSRRFVVLAG